MRNIGSDSEMHRHRNFRAIGVCKDARFKMFGLQSRTGKKLARRFAEPDLAALRTKRSFVEENAGFLGHSEFAITKNSFTSSEVPPTRAISKSWTSAAPFIAMPLTKPRFMRSISRGPRPTLMTWPPMPQRIALPALRESKIASRIRRKSSAARMRGSDSRKWAKLSPALWGRANWRKLTLFGRFASG